MASGKKRLTFRRKCGLGGLALMGLAAAFVNSQPHSPIGKGLAVCGAILFVIWLW